MFEEIRAKESAPAKGRSFFYRILSRSPKLSMEDHHVLTRLLGAVSSSLPADLKVYVRTTGLGGRMVSSLARLKTPGIVYLSGDALLGFSERWYDEIEAITRAEKHLLTKTRKQLEPAANAGRVTIAIDTSDDYRVVGCIVLWELCEDEGGVMWYELGTYVVSEEYRFRARGPHAMPIGDALYHNLLYTHRKKNILGTTTNTRSIHIGMRHGMQMLSFAYLPEAVRRASCICPVDKTGVTDNWSCHILDTQCRVRVTRPTWVRIGMPHRLPYT
jgi:hypothetical protein